jgi:hypothetical protein
VDDPAQLGRDEVVVVGTGHEHRGGDLLQLGRQRGDVAVLPASEPQDRVEERGVAGGIVAGDAGA